MRERGKFIWKEYWISLCSNHREYDEKCPRCNVGTWQNELKNKIGKFFHDKHYELWHWWKNRGGSIKTANRFNKKIKRHE